VTNDSGVLRAPARNVDGMRHKRLVTALAVAGGTTYAISRWPRMATWGATSEEADAVMPGDEIVGEARYRTTHAVDIDAPVEEVWPWLAQMGQGRGGLYSYDWLENALGLDIHSVDRVVPDLQALDVGDSVRMVPEGSEPELVFTVARAEPPHLLVLGPRGTREEAMESGLPYSCWTFLLKPRDRDRTRLVVRLTSDFKPTPAGFLVNKYALGPVHFVMERKMLLGIRERAERAAA
jgi:hypothetical protein